VSALTFWQGCKVPRGGERVVWRDAAEMFALLDTRHAIPAGDTASDRKAAARDTRCPRFLWSPAAYRDDTRANDAALAITALVLDYDRGEVLPGEALAPWEGYAAFWQETLSSTPLAVRFHLVIPFSRPVLPALWPGVWEACLQRAVPGVDRKCGDLARQYFSPFEGRERGYQDGELFTPPPPLVKPRKAPVEPPPRRPGIPRGAPSRGSGRIELTSSALFPEVAEALGLEVIGGDGRWGCRPCPACGREERASGSRGRAGYDGRAPVETTNPQVWRCFQCEQSGGVLDLAALVLVRSRMSGINRQDYRVVRGWLESHGFAVSGEA